MSILQVKGRTTSELKDFEPYCLSSNSLIFTDADTDNIENFSLSLTLGDGWNEAYSESNKNLIEIDDKINISGGDSIVIQVRENIKLPHNRYGIILPTGSLFLSKGILIAPAKVEPSFSGYLRLRLYNTTRKKISLKKGEKLGSIVFFQTESTTIQVLQTRKKGISERPLTKLALVKKWFIDNRVLQGWAIALISAIAIIASPFIFHYFNNDPEYQKLQIKNEVEKQMSILKAAESNKDMKNKE